MKKSVTELKKQRAILFFDLAIRRLSGEITKEQHNIMYKRVERAFVNTYFTNFKTDKQNLIPFAWMHERSGRNALGELINNNLKARI